MSCHICAYRHPNGLLRTHGGAVNSLEPEVKVDYNQDSGNKSDIFDDSDLDNQDFAPFDGDESDYGTEPDLTSTLTTVDEGDIAEQHLLNKGPSSSFCVIPNPESIEVKYEKTHETQCFRSSKTEGVSSSDKLSEYLEHESDDIFDSISDNELHQAITNLSSQPDGQFDEGAYDADDEIFNDMVLIDEPASGCSHGDVSNYGTDNRAADSSSSNSEGNSLVTKSTAPDELRKIDEREIPETRISSEKSRTDNTFHVHYPPITRSSFPPPVLDRSPIDSLTPTPTLKTCFRTGHAQQTGTAAYRLNLASKTLLEIYARVALSYREVDKCGNLNGRQIFELADLFHDRPPVLCGVYEGWLGVPLLEEDTNAFLKAHVDGEMRMCRCIARMERRDGRWELGIMSIWEAEWEDILHVYGIVCA